MARSIPPDRFAQLVDASTRTFIVRGYRLTQVADVADSLGIAKGTIYGYVESKEALFDACVRYADRHLTPPSSSELPIRTPATGATVKHIRERLAIEASEMTLLHVVGGHRTIPDARAELAAILSDLYRRVARNRLALKLIDRCAAEYPDLAGVWFDEGRWAQHKLLVEFLERRAKQKRIRRLERPDIVARTILETIAFWAMHRHFDPSPQPIDEATAEAAVVDLFAEGLLKGPRGADR
jgi:AcrR family transcriptional regulator